MTVPFQGFLTRHAISLLGILILLPIVTCGGLASWWFARQSMASQKVDEMRAEIRSRGLPIDDKTLTEFRSRQMSHQKSDRWSKLLKEIDSEEFESSYAGLPILDGEVEVPNFEPGKSYPFAEQAQRFLQQWNDLRQEIHELTEGSGAIWTEVDFHGYATLLPLAQASRRVTKLLELEHGDAIARNDRQQAFISLRAMIGASRTHEKEPMLISQLVHGAMLHVAMSGLRESVQLDLMTEAELRQVLAELLPLDDFGTGYRLGIAGERAMSQPMFDDLSEFGDYGEVPAASALGGRRIDALSSLQFMAAAEQVDTTDLTQFFVEIDAVSEKFEVDGKQANFLRKFDTVLTQLLAPPLGAYGQAIARKTMEVRIAKLAIGLRLFRIQHGYWPDSLDQMTKATIDADLGPVTPIGGKPFGYSVKKMTVDLWGFAPELPSDTTPTEPMDLSILNDREIKTRQYWHWTLSSP